MKKLGLQRRIAPLKPFTPWKMKLQRRQYALHHDWQRTFFIDKAAVRLNGQVRTWVTRRKGEAYRQECLQFKLLSGETTKMVRGAISHGGRSELVQFNKAPCEGKRQGFTAKLYGKQISKGELYKCWKRVTARCRGYGQPWLLEDGARIHTSSTSRGVGLKRKCRYFNHPPYSTNLNPIENCWTWLKRKVAMLQRHPHTLEGGFQAALRLWAEMPQVFIDNMIDSMPKRLRSVRRNGGAPTMH